MTKRLSWAVRLERAEKRGKFTQQEIDLAGDWTKCAVGERHNFPKESAYADDFLYESTQEGRLGIEFMYAVQNGNIPKAKRIYAGIQALP